MRISANITSRSGEHSVTVATENHRQPVVIPPKPEGRGSSVNGGELLFLALATCYCNDLYREARRRSIEIETIEVEVSGEFNGEGNGAESIEYRARVSAPAAQEAILELMHYTDTVAEIQNTLRNSPPVVLAQCEARDTTPPTP
jgi:organic hydroperoxide reductase OsmC/OhrA